MDTAARKPAAAQGPSPAAHQVVVLLWCYCQCVLCSSQLNACIAAATATAVIAATAAAAAGSAGAVVAGTPMHRHLFSRVVVQCRDHAAEAARAQNLDECVAGANLQRMQGNTLLT